MIPLFVYLLVVLLAVSSMWALFHGLRLIAYGVQGVGISAGVFTSLLFNTVAGIAVAYFAATTLWPDIAAW